MKSAGALSGLTRRPLRSMEIRSPRSRTRACHRQLEWTLQDSKLSRFARAGAGADACFELLSPVPNGEGPGAP